VVCRLHMQASASRWPFVVAGECGVCRVTMAVVRGSVASSLARSAASRVVTGGEPSAA
jgi:hypothetical protein